MDLEPDFDEFCALLLDRRVEFVIVGAHALALHGAPRYTGDLDVLVRPTDENAERLIAAIHSFWLPDIPMTAAQFGSRIVPFIGRAEFLKNKRAAGRLKDLADIEALSDPNN